MKGNSDMNVNGGGSIFAGMKRYPEGDNDVNMSGVVDEANEGGETPFMGNHVVKTVRNLKRLR
jgi:hypothetical protein